MKILFLDIDGVLNSTRTALALGGYPMTLDAAGLDKFDMVAVRLIRQLCRQHDIAVVLSSAWRLMHDYREVATALDLPIIDRTPSMSGPRGYEIAAWLSEHPEVTQYVIVDDDGDMLPVQQRRFVHTDGHDGLTWHKFSKMCKLFGIAPHSIVPSRTAVLEAA